MKLNGIFLAVALVIMVSIPCAQASSISNSNRDTIVTPSASSGHPWPMFGHDLNHSCRSEYNTTMNNGQKKWDFTTLGPVESSPAIDSDDTIYFGSLDRNLYALYSNGTEKWKFASSSANGISSSPAIDTNGTIYCGSNGLDNIYLYAIYPNGTKKWAINFLRPIKSSPAIGLDGTIYVPIAELGIYAIYPNGTIKWKYPCSPSEWSSPAIDLNGIIYVGKSNANGTVTDGLYAMNPNGTKKWEFNTSHGPVSSSPSISYVTSNCLCSNESNKFVIYFLSFDGILYCLYPNGTKKWEFNMHTPIVVWSTPAVGSDGTIYIGVDKLYAVYPNGTKKWEFNTGQSFNGCPAIGSDGTIYIASTYDKIFAVYPNGTKKWEFVTGWFATSSPAIGSDGTIYVGSENGKIYAIGYVPVPEFTSIVVFVPVALIALFVVMKSAKIRKEKTAK